MYEGLIDRLARKNDSRMLLAVLDGLGDIPNRVLGGRTPLEAARTPNMDRLAGEGALGMHLPIARGVTPGSGPAHLGLFGYDPVRYEVGRGVLSALGIGFPLEHGDLAARINFSTIDDDGVVIDRRAGRISTEKCRELVSVLQGITIEGLEVHVLPVKEHRACLVLRGEGLDEDVNDTDPGIVGEKPVPVGGTGRSSEAVREFQARARELLADRHPANFILMRGFALHREFPSMSSRFRLSPAAVALYPMYRGVASLVGMEVFDCPSQDLEGEAQAVMEALDDGRDFIFLHHKPADSSGEDGDAEAKVSAIEAFDRFLPAFLEPGFDVVAITGDHSTPCPMKLHSWHPVPVLMHGGPLRTGYSTSFSEKQALAGSLGSFHSTDLLPLMMASAGKLVKFGA